MSTLFRKVRPLTKARFDAVFSSFSRREWYVFGIVMLVLVGSFLRLISLVSNRFSEVVPAHGGTYVEGIVGTPRFVNPVIALTDADRDIASLVYSGLVRKNTSGEIVPDLAEAWTVSDDGLSYTFTIRPDARFQDDTEVTAADVAYTIGQIQNDGIKSPLRVKWEGVTTETPDDHTVVFTLKQPFIGFIENAGVGILPAHLWEDVPTEEFSFSDKNTHPVGSGPYRVVSIKEKKSGVPESYSLRAWGPRDDRAYIRTIELRFYPSETARIDALKDGAIDSAAAVGPLDALELADRGFAITETTLPRIFGLYWNTSKAPILADKTVVGALERAIDKERLVNEILAGHGVAIGSPIPSSISGKPSEGGVFDPESANAMLDKAGWTIGEDGVRHKKTDKGDTKLTFTISTSDTPELKQTAEYIQEDLAHIGVFADIRVFEVGTLNQSVIRERDYEALLFGEVVSRESDLFAFWHSSQRNDPGLNVALYANKNVDAALEKNAKDTDMAARLARYDSIETEIAKDKPAIFLYSPSFVYATDEEVGGMSLGAIATPSDRFLDIRSWFVASNHVWPIFLKK